MKPKFKIGDKIVFIDSESGTKEYGFLNKIRKYGNGDIEYYYNNKYIRIYDNSIKKCTKKEIETYFNF